MKSTMFIFIVGISIVAIVVLRSRLATAVNPLPPDPSILPIPAQSFMSGSTALFTQRALQLAPAIFRKFIDDAIIYMENYRLDDQESRSGCCSRFDNEHRPSQLGISFREDWYAKLSTASKNIHLGDGPILKIIDSANLQVDATVHIHMIVQVFFREYMCCLETPIKDICCGSDTVCDNSQVWIDTDLHIRINIQVENTGTSVALHPTVSLSYPNGVNHGGCKCDLFCRFAEKFVDVDGMITRAVQDRIQNDVNSKMQAISTGGVYSPYYGIAFRYSLKSAVLLANENVRGYVSIVVYALDLQTQKWLIYEDHNQERSTTYPPFEWPSSGLPLPLAGLRIGTNVMNGIAWASEIIGTFKSHGNDIVEDVFLDEDVHWYGLKISVPSNEDQALIHIDYASINMTCQFDRFNCSDSTLDTNSSSCIVPQPDIDVNAVPFLVASVTNIELNSTMYMTVVDDRPGVYLQATGIDSETLNITIEKLPLPLPPSVEQSLMKHILVRSVSVINPLLLKYPLLLPSELVPYFPHPTCHLFSQNNSQSQNVGYGYLDIASNERIQYHPAYFPRLLFHGRGREHRSIQPLGIHVLMYESEYEEIQNTHCSIAHSGLTVSLFVLPPTAFINSTAIIAEHNDYFQNFSAQCLNTSAFSSAFPYYSLLQDSVTGTIIAINFMCSDPQCEQCQFQQEFSMDIKQNPIYTEQCLQGKYIYSFNRSFSLRLTPWTQDDKNNQLKTCTIDTKSGISILPQLDFHLAKPNDHFFFTYFTVDSSALQCGWDDAKINTTDGKYVMNIMNLGSNMITRAHAHPSLLFNESHPCEYYSECEHSSSSSIWCSAAQIRDQQNCYTFEAFCISNCSACQLDTVELARAACLNTCSFTDSTINTTIVATSILSAEEIWKSNCCLNTACRSSTLPGKLMGIICSCIGFFIILIISVVIYRRKKRFKNEGETDERRPLLNPQVIRQRLHWRINLSIRPWLFQTFQKPSLQHTAPIHIISMVCSLFNMVWLGYLCYCWIHRSPFQFVLDSSVDEARYGLSDKYIEDSKAKEDFWHWQIAGIWVTIISMVFMLLPFAHFFVQSEKKKSFQRFVQYVLVLVLTMHLSILLLPTFIYVFSGSIIVRPSPDTFIQNDNDTREFISYVIGGVFTQYAFLLLQSLIMYCIQSIRSGIIFALLIYIIITVDRLKIMNLITRTEEEVIEKLNRHLNATIVYINTCLDCARLFICVIEIINFIGCLLPAILIYQIRQYNYQWPFIWLLSKIIPFFLLFILVPISISGTFRKHFRLRFLIALIIYICLVFITTILLLNAEMNILAIEWQFPTVLTLFMTTISMNITLITLDSTFFLDQNENDADEIFVNDVPTTRYEITLVRLGVTLERIAFFVLKFIIRLPFLLIYYLVFYLPRRLCCHAHLHETNQSHTASISHSLTSIKDFFLQNRERNNSRFYGHRMSLTRCCIWLGFGSSIFLTCMKYKDVRVPSKQKFIKALADADFITDWPPESEGGSIFDSSFAKLDSFLHYSFYCYVAVTAFLFITLLTDFLSHLQTLKARFWLRCSQLTSLLTLGFLFAAVLLPAMPNYIEAANLDKVCQSCHAPQFDQLIEKMFSGMIGTIAQAYLLMNLFPVLLAISPTAVRVATLSLHDLKHSYEQLAPSIMTVDTIAYKEKSRHLLRLIHMSAAISPILIALPLSLMYQTLRVQLNSNNPEIPTSLPLVLGILIALFLLVPLLFELSFFSTVHTYRTNYYLYILSYIGLLIVIVIYLSTLKPLHNIIIEQLKSIEFIFAIIAEITVSNVIFGNLISFFIKF